MSHENLIELDHIIKTYQMGDYAFNALKSVNLRVEAGELLAIMGSSGSGKSTLMNIIGLLDRANSGRYQLAGHDVSALSEDERAQYRNQFIGFVFQSFYLLPKLNALQNVGLPLFYRREPADVIELRAKEMLKRVGMESRLYHKPTELSGGQQQRVAIARALVGHPKIILADEPTGALDTQTGEDVMNLLIELNNIEQTTIVIVTHDPDIAAHCKRVIHMSDGQIKDN